MGNTQNKLTIYKNKLKTCKNILEIHKIHGEHINYMGNKKIWKAHNIYIYPQISLYILLIGPSRTPHSYQHMLGLLVRNTLVNSHAIIFVGRGRGVGDDL